MQMISEKIQIAEANTERYGPLKEFCSKARKMNYTEFQNKEDELLCEFLDLLDRGIEDFNINDIIIDFNTPNRYSTPLQYILLSERDIFIHETYKRFLDIIEIDVDKKNKELFYKDLLCVLYEQIVWDSGTTDNLLPLIYKSESLDFFRFEMSVSKKLLIVKFLINQKDNYKCSDTFLQILQENHKFLLKEREDDIVSGLSLCLRQTLSKINELDENNCPISNDLKEVKEKILSYIKNTKESHV